MRVASFSSFTAGSVSAVFGSLMPLLPINERKTLRLRRRGGGNGGRGGGCGWQSNGCPSIKTGVKSRAACLPSIYPPCERRRLRRRREEAAGGGRIIERKEKLRRNDSAKGSSRLRSSSLKGRWKSKTPLKMQEGGGVCGLGSNFGCSTSS